MPPRNQPVRSQMNVPERAQILQHGITETNFDYAVQRGMSASSILALIATYGPMAVQIINGIVDAFRSGEMPTNQPPQPGTNPDDPPERQRQSWSPAKEAQAEPPKVETESAKKKP